MVEEVESEVPAKMKRPLPCGILQGVHPHAEAVHAKPSDERGGSKAGTDGHQAHAPALVLVVRSQPLRKHLDTEPCEYIT